MDSTLERQAIRVAVALAASSTHGKTAEAISDVRDESTHLMSLCMQEDTTPHQLCAWCDDVTALIERLVASDAFDRGHALNAIAGILRLRLTVIRLVQEIDERTAKKSGTASGEHTAQVLAPEPQVIVLTDNAQKVLEYIQSNPGVRTKELVESFAKTFSPRSTKRYIAELLEAKVVRRKELEGRGVVYIARS